MRRISNPWRGLGDLPRDAWVIFATTLVNRAGTMVLPFLVLYITQDLGYSASQAGFAITLYGLGGLISASIAGQLSDRIGAVRVMYFSLILSGALLIALPAVRSLVLVFALITVWAVIGEALRPASLAALSACTPPHQRKAALALNRLAINLGMSVGPAIGGFLAAASFYWLFLIDGTTSIAAALVLAMLVRTQSSVTGRRRETEPQVTVSAVRDPRMLRFMLALFLVGVMFFQLEAALPLYIVRDLGLSQSFLGLLFSLNTVLIIAFEIPLNLATTHWPYRRGLVLATLIMSAGFGPLALATSQWSVALTVVIWTLGEMLLFPVAGAYVADLAPPHRQGEYMGGYWTALSLARMVGPWGGTLVLDRFGASVLWTLVFLCGLFTAAVFGLVMKPATVSRSVAITP